MSKASRAKATTRAKASAASRASALPEPNVFLLRWGTVLAGGIIVLAAVAAYYDSFSGPFILDDQFAIRDNPSIRHFGSALSPPLLATTGGRPLLNLTFALNYALGGLDVSGYHVFNLFIHVLAGLMLFGIVRRTLLCLVFSRLRVAGPPAPNPGTIAQELSSSGATLLALVIAVIWVVHPLQTEAVTYISQRAESLMGLFYLLTLYCFIRSQDSGDRRQETASQRSESGSPPNSAFSFQPSALWLGASILSCLLGAMSKEIIVTAPVMVLLYDRTFVAGSFREAWQSRWQYYLGLACTWLLLASLMTGLSQRGIGFDPKVTWWIYALTSCRSVVLYCKLAIWPYPLVFDYGTNMIWHADETVPYALILAALLACTAIALLRRPVIGFAGTWFFMIIAPTTSVVPIFPMGEHRLYLSLASVVALVVLGLHRWVGRRGLVVCAVAAVGLGWLSVQRNKDYHSALAIWSDTSAKRPDNARSHNNLGCVLLDIPGRLPDAIAEYQAALQIDPDFGEVHNNLGAALLRTPGRLPDAISHFETAIRLNPHYADAHDNLGVALSKIPGRLPDAISHFEAALHINPDFAPAYYNLGLTLAKIPGRLPDAISQYESALRIDPDFAEAQYDLGKALMEYPRRIGEAIGHFETALKLKPDYADAQNCLGISLAKSGRIAEAIPHFEAALRIEPDSAQVHVNLGRALVSIGRSSEAEQHFQTALKLEPALGEARQQLELLKQAQ